MDVSRSITLTGGTTHRRRRISAMHATAIPRRSRRSFRTAAALSSRFLRPLLARSVILDVPTSPIALVLIPRTDHAIVFDIAEAKVDCANHEISGLTPRGSNLIAESCTSLSCRSPRATAGRSEIAEGPPTPRDRPETALHALQVNTQSGQLAHFVASHVPCIGCAQPSMISPMKIPPAATAS